MAQVDRHGRPRRDCAERRQRTVHRCQLHRCQLHRRPHVLVRPAPWQCLLSPESATSRLPGSRRRPRRNSFLRLSWSGLPACPAQYECLLPAFGTDGTCCLLLPLHPGRHPIRCLSRFSMTRRDTFDPPLPLLARPGLTVMLSELDSFLPSPVQMAPWAPQSVVAGQGDGHVAVALRLYRDAPGDVAGLVRPLRPLHGPARHVEGMVLQGHGSPGPTPR